jgi:glycerol-3-phosphate acyltransferase PlsY
VNWILYSVAVVAGYFLGSIPTGYFVARARGVDIRAFGSGNIGATNVFRALGKGAGIFVLLADAAKGALAAGFLPGLILKLAASPASASSEGLAIAAGVAAILGHNYTCWLHFKGGKGIATSAGVLLVLMPKGLGLALVVWLVVFVAWRYVSLASIVAAAALPVLVWLTGASPTLIGIALVLGALAVYKHRSNIQRLRAGTESRFTRRSPAADRPSS